MQRFCNTCLAISFALLSGCGSLLSSMGMGTIEDHPAERTLAQVLEDDNIETKAMVNIHAENDAYHQAHLVIVSYNGYVLLAGQVADEALKKGATEVIRKIKGVRRIYNELEIGPPTNAITRSNDTWLTTKIKSYLIGDSAINGMQVKIVTENGVVYLMGLVEKKDAGHITDVAATTSGVTRVVRLFEFPDQ
ncbi:MAG: BON domain-containing protein [Halioglobus sp.]|nr:BON domain-containing protein [Halioglobus sp.]